MILAPLGSKDIANLRLASRSFRHLPYILWHDLLQKEMPWIWEAWSDRPYPLMACTTQRELMAHDQAIARRKRDVANLPDEQKSFQEQQIARDDSSFRKPRPVEQLSRLYTDWHWLYCELRREFKNIKGLQNRERIWKAVEYVVRRIASPDEDLMIARQKHARAFPYQDCNPPRMANREGSSRPDYWGEYKESPQPEGDFGMAEDEYGDCNDDNETRQDDSEVGDDDESGKAAGFKSSSAASLH